MSIFISNRQRAKKIDSRLLKKIVTELLAELQIANAELGIVLVGAMEMASLNEKFLRHEGSTDVITFNYSDKTSRKTAVTPTQGEIFICIDDAILRAKQFKTNWQSEIIRYIVHGILHLLGHDDLRAGLRRKMKREENRLLRELSRRFVLSQL